jgi:hypothetical protein
MRRVSAPEIGNQVFDDPHIRQWVDRCRRGQIGNESRASQPVRTIDVHRAGAADALATRATEGESGVHCVLDPDESVQNHRATGIQIDFESTDTRVTLQVRIVTIDLKHFHPSGAR